MAKYIIDIPETVQNRCSIISDVNPSDQLFRVIKNAIPLEKVLEDIKAELWYEGHNFTGEYQGVWVRYKDIEKAINSHISEKEKE